MEDLYCLNNKTEYTKQKVVIEDDNQNLLKKDTIKEKVIIEDINQIYDTECSILNYNVTGKYIEGDIRLTYLYSSFESTSLNKKEEIFKFQLQIESEVQNIQMEIKDIRSNLLPDSSIETEIDVDIYSKDLAQNEISLIKEISIGEEDDTDDGYSMIVYFVKPQDSLWKIAKKFKSTVSDIASINEISDEDKIQYDG